MHSERRFLSQHTFSRLSSHWQGAGASCPAGGMGKDCSIPRFRTQSDQPARLRGARLQQRNPARESGCLPDLSGAQPGKSCPWALHRQNAAAPGPAPSVGVVPGADSPAQPSPSPSFRFRVSRYPAIGKGPALQALLEERVKAMQAHGFRSLSCQMFGSEGPVFVTNIGFQDMASLEAFLDNNQRDPEFRAYAE